MTYPPNFANLLLIHQEFLFYIYTNSNSFTFFRRAIATQRFTTFVGANVAPPVADLLLGIIDSRKFIISKVECCDFGKHFLVVYFTTLSH
jgi:hypothetical protein